MLWSFELTIKNVSDALNTAFLSCSASDLVQGLCLQTRAIGVMQAREPVDAHLRVAGPGTKVHREMDMLPEAHICSRKWEWSGRPNLHPIPLAVPTIADSPDKCQSAFDWQSPSHGDNNWEEKNYLINHFWWLEKNLIVWAVKPVQSHFHLTHKFKFRAYLYMFWWMHTLYPSVLRIEPCDAAYIHLYYGWILAHWKVPVWNSSSIASTTQVAWEIRTEVWRKAPYYHKGKLLRQALYWRILIVYRISAGKYK